MHSHRTSQAMSEEQLKAFWEAIQADTGLQQKLQGITEPDAISAIAKEAGFNISAEEIKKAQLELTDEQLDGLAGGEYVCWGTCGFC
jgi:predicted ribosomally synthesized peptide with nif11-like leader